MILKGSQRGGAKQLGLHLLKTVENEHVEFHDVRGFMTDDVVGDPAKRSWKWNVAMHELLGRERRLRASMIRINRRERC